MAAKNELTPQIHGGGGGSRPVFRDPKSNTNHESTKDENTKKGSQG
jgi:hypothetical protein